MDVRYRNLIRIVERGRAASDKAGEGSHGGLVPVGDGIASEEAIVLRDGRVNADVSLINVVELRCLIEVIACACAGLSEVRSWYQGEDCRRGWIDQVRGNYIAGKGDAMTVPAGPM